MTKPKIHASLRPLLMTRSCVLQFVCIATSVAITAVAGERRASEVIKEYCFDCHDHDAKKGGLDLEALQTRDVTADSTTWEKVVRKMGAHQMPPVGKPRPDKKTYDAT